jgi:hypothetical protein
MKFWARDVLASLPPASIPILLLALTITAIGFGQWSTVTSLHNGLSRIADQWTEADTLRAAQGYAQLGFAANAGLPDLCFGEQFSDIGTKKLLRDDLGRYAAWEAGALSYRADKVDSQRFIYTHYPPGPHWLAGAMTKALGTGKTNLYRILPVALGLFAIAYLACEMAASIGLWPAAISLLFFAALPMFTNMMHGLSYQGYAFALLLIQLALCLRMCREGLSTGLWWLVGFVGFMQGWLGFDYFFLVAAAPLAVWLALRTSMSARQVVLSCAVGVLGYCLANTLHFIEVVSYYGSVKAALNDLTAVAHYRSAGAVLDGGKSADPALVVLWDYLATYTALPMFLNASILLLCASGVAVLLLMRRAFGNTTLLRPLLAIGLSIAIASCWVVLMPQHSAQHWHFIPRHYFLPVFVIALVIAAELRQPNTCGRDEFRIMWFAGGPLFVVAALILRHSDLAPLTDSVLPLATFESILAYVLAYSFAFYCWQYRRVTWTRMLILGPLLYVVVLAIVMSADDLLWLSRSDALHVPSIRLEAVIAPALVAGFLLAGFGWVVSRKLERRPHLSAARLATD